MPWPPVWTGNESSPLYARLSTERSKRRNDMLTDLVARGTPESWDRYMICGLFHLSIATTTSKRGSR